MSISVVKNGESSKYRALVRTKDGNFRKEISTSDVHNTFVRRLLGKEPISKAVLKAIDPSLPISKLKSVNDPRVPQALLNLEEKQVWL
jgi:RAP1 GTPase activating protein 1